MASPLKKGNVTYTEVPTSSNLVKKNPKLSLQIPHSCKANELTWGTGENGFDIICSNQEYIQKNKFAFR